MEALEKLRRVADTRGFIIREIPRDLWKETYPTYNAVCDSNYRRIMYSGSLFHSEHHLACTLAHELGHMFFNTDPSNYDSLYRFNGKKLEEFDLLDRVVWFEQEVIAWDIGKEVLDEMRLPYVSSMDFYKNENLRAYRKILGLQDVELFSWKNI